jgi:MFS family permease
LICEFEQECLLEEGSADGDGPSTFSAQGDLVIDNMKYSYCSLIFYWGYLLGRTYFSTPQSFYQTHSHLLLLTDKNSVLPGVYFSQRFPVGKYVAIVTILWGGVTVSTVAVKSYEGLMVQRFFLGVTEAGIAPAFSLITAMWYKRQEQPLRFAIWFSAVGLGTLVGTLLLYAM